MSVAEEVKELVAPILQSLGFELFDVTFTRSGGYSLLRVFIDKDGGVTIDDCQNASREIAAILDVKDRVPGRYNLEVSSPGINRAIRNEKDYERYQGSKIKVKLLRAVSNQKTFVGINRGVEGETLRLEISSDQEIRIPVHEISKANLEVDF